MSLFRRELQGLPASSLIPPRTGSPAGSVTVTTDTAMRHSAVWACLRLRAGLISTFPVDVFRKVGNLQVEMPAPPVLKAPGGAGWDYIDWMYASQVDLDRCGNAIGVITATNSAGLPAQIELQSSQDVTVIQKRDGTVKYRIGVKEFTPEKIWHERQYRVPGMVMGLSPIAYAAWSIGQYQSAQQFALDWYGSGGIAKGHFKNNSVGAIGDDVAGEFKARFKAATESRDVFVTGKDWEYSPFQAEAVGEVWLASQQYGISDVARFMDCPGDLIDAAVQAGNITYANITQRNLQFLIMHLGPAVTRREKRLSELLPAPRFVKLNTSALLRMDDQTRTEVMARQIESRALAPSEARAENNRLPFTDAQIAEFDRLFGAPRITPVPAAGA